MEELSGAPVQGKTRLNWRAGVKYSGVEQRGLVSMRCPPEYEASCKTTRKSSRQFADVRGTHHRKAILAVSWAFWHFRSSKDLAGRNG